MEDHEYVKDTFFRQNHEPLEFLSEETEHTEKKTSMLRGSEYQGPVLLYGSNATRFSVCTLYRTENRIQS
ncbi:hypothetical protein CN980_25935, partial [Bacillus cereus]